MKTIGRDGYILAQALTYAAVLMEESGLPWDEPSNREDMETLLEGYLGQYRGLDFTDRAHRMIDAIRGQAK